MEPAGDMDADGSTEAIGVLSNTVNLVRLAGTNWLQLASTALYCSNDIALLGDVTGSGLPSVMLTSPVYGRGANFGPSNASPIETSQFADLLLPCYPYPLSPTELPARYAGRANWFKFDIPNFEDPGTLMTVGLNPYATIAIQVGLPDTNGLAPVTLPAASLSFPDTIFFSLGRTNGNIWIRIEAAGRDGGGWVYVSGPRTGDMEIVGDLRVSLWFGADGKSAQTLLPGMAEECKVRFRSVEPLDLKTGRVVIGGVTRLPSLWLLMFQYMFGGFGDTLPEWAIPRLRNVLHALAFEIYVDQVPPATQGGLCCTPANIAFPSVEAGSTSTPVVLQFCNLGTQALHVISLPAPSAPFAWKNPPNLPLTVPAHGSVSMGVTFAPPASGRYEQFITWQSDDPVRPAQTVQLTGFGIARGATDSDGDGIDDEFERTHATPADTNVISVMQVGHDDSWLDYDGDGIDSFAEYLAGTDPSDPLSYFHITSVSNWPSSHGISFPSVSNRQYRLQRSATLAADSWTNVPGAGPVNGNGTPLALSDTNAVPKAFYRVEVRGP